MTSPLEPIRELPITRPAKRLMALQVFVAVLILMVLIARARGA
jgi:hypothetical protein